MQFRSEDGADYGDAEHSIHGGRLIAKVGDTFSRIDLRDKGIPADVLDAWYPPAPPVVAALREHLPWLMQTSPSCRADGLRRTLAAWAGVNEGALLVGSGSSDLIFRLVPAFLEELTNGAAAKVGIVSPCYSEYEFVMRQHKVASIVRIHSDSEDFAWDVDSVRRTVREHDLRALCLVNPCNPTGYFADRARMSALLGALPAGVRVIVDETYIDYVGRQESLAPLAAKHHNILVIQSLSKTFALSGLRAGLAVVHPEVASRLQRRTPTYVVGSATTLALRLSLEHWPYYEEQIATTHALRRALSAQLQAASPGARVIPSQINAVLIDLRHTRSARALASSLARDDIYVRVIDDQGPPEPDRYLRVSVRSAAENDAVATAWRRVWSE